MASTKFVICLAVLFSAAMAAAGRGRIISIIDEFVPITARQSESSEFYLDESSAGFGRLTRTGISVTRGASAVLNFDITVKAIDAERLHSRDAKFVETLSTEERVQYESFKSEFRGGLNIPFLRLFGANFNKKVTREDLDRAASTLTNYAAKSSVAEEILESAVDTMIRITGTLEAEGVSFRPTVAFAFIRLARATFEDGSSQYVVSNDPNDLAAATRGGDEVPNEGKKLNILLG